MKEPGGDLDRYLKESCHSFKEAKVKNSARRNSLLKKTLGIENERRLTNASMDREEKLLREQLRQMKVSKKSSLAAGRIHQKEARKCPDKTDRAKREIPSGDVDPYPVTFPVRRTASGKKNKLEQQGAMYAARRGRRVSKEFEDLHLETSTGKLAAKFLHSKLSTPPPSVSPSIARRIMGSQTSLSSSDEGTWAGDPEAIGSVRRSRKSVVQQELERQGNRSRTNSGSEGT